MTSQGYAIPWITWEVRLQSRWATRRDNSEEYLTIPDVYQPCGVIEVVDTSNQ